MKKILSICFVFCIILSLLLGLTVVSSAAGIEKNIGGSISKVTYSQTNSGEEIKLFTSNTEILRQFILSPNSDCANYRLGFDIKDATVQNNGSMDVKQGSVVQVRYAIKKDPKSVSIVIETTKKPQYTIAPSSDGKSLVVKLSGTVSNPPAATPSPTPKPSATPSATPKPVATPSATPKPSSTPVPVTNTTDNAGSVSSGSGTITKSGPISWSLQNDTCVVKLDGVNLSQATASGKMPTIELREKEKLLQIQIPGKDTRFVNGILSGNNLVHGILVNYNEKLDATVIRISWKQQIAYSHEVSSGSSIVRIKSAAAAVGSANPTPTPKPSATPTPSSTPIPVTDPNRGEASRTPNVTTSFAPDAITINSATTAGYKIYRIGSPSRIVMEVPGVVTPTDKLMQAGSLYQRATVTQLNATTGKIILETSEMPQWTVSESTGKLEVKLNSSGTSNLEGGANDGQVALRIKGANIVNKYRQYASNILTENNTTAGTYAFMLPADVAILGQGNANIEDNLLKSVTTFTTEQNSFLLLNKKDPSKEFKIMESSNSDELLVVVSNTSSSSGTGTQSANNKKLVVLDPGHGGYDPGGDVGTYYEKHYNLDISLRVETILKQRGVNVLMTRRTDVFVELTDRAKIANDNGAALFVSIHNNKMPNPAYKGSMALYYPTSYKGKEYAKIFLNNLTKLGLGGMGTVGLSARGDLVVLKQTKMPSVLLEIACMTNSDDLALLNTDTFKQQVAENIADSIVQMVNGMN